ncbi:hypothetical protein AB0M79_35295, partial [Polymorphospora sp. NPDC051019]|uniref:hypothetical protein n=1 Tax=Polymorphospora sp. NPDC051019 TaxID=3155725 RepID=UPI003445E5D7
MTNELPRAAVDDDVVMSARRYLDVVAAVAWLTGVAVSAATVAQDTLPAVVLAGTPGIEVILAPAVFGLVNAVIVVCGELVLRRRLGDVRRAALVRRSFRDI